MIYLYYITIEVNCRENIFVWKCSLTFLYLYNFSNNQHSNTKQIMWKLCWNVYKRIELVEIQLKQKL